MKTYKVYLDGGDRNGAERYYNSRTTAIQQAKRYVTRCSRKFGLSDDSWAEVHEIENGKKKLIYSCGW